MIVHFIDRRIKAMLLALGMSFVSAAQAATDEDLLHIPDWHVYGSNTYRIDDYNAYGDKASSPYPFTGIHNYDELNLNFERSFTPYNRVSGQINGLLYNASRYRSTFKGAVPERLNIRQENGDFVIPYRLEVGDFFAFQSFRTMQRTLKGVQMEFQPDWWGLRHSILLFSGGGSPTWRSFQLDDDWSTGASWLIEHPDYGRMSANLVFNQKQANQALSLLPRQQYVYSLAYEKTGVWTIEDIPSLSQRLTVEGEAGHFIGDHADLSGVGSGKNRKGNGYFLQVSGSPVTLPALGYRARFEAYNQDYQPNGGNIQSDRLSKEGHISWRFSSGLTARGRFQRFRSGWKTTNPVDTDVYGVNFSGPLGSSGVSGGLSAFVQNAESRDLTVNNITKVFNSNISKAINSRLSAQAAIFYSNTRDKTNATTGASITRQYSAGVNWRMSAWGWDGTVSPGVLYRAVRPQGSGVQQDINPTLNFNAIRGPQTLSLSWSALDQGRPSNLGLVTRTAGLNYTYRKKAYTLGLEGNWYERNPDKITSARTDAWHMGAFVTWNFDKPVHTSVATTPEEEAFLAGDDTPAIEHSSATDRFALDITAIKPNMSVNDALQWVEDAGLGKPTEQAGLLLWFTRVMRDIHQNQRLALEVNNAVISRTDLVIEFDDINDTAGVRRTFERVSEQLLQKYGQPDAFFSRGDFSTNLIADVAASRFIHVLEWKRNGGILRFGIPSRTDGKVRMELQFASSFPALQDSHWSMDALQ